MHAVVGESFSLKSSDMKMEQRSAAVEVYL